MATINGSDTAGVQPIATFLKSLAQHESAKGIPLVAEKLDDLSRWVLGKGTMTFDEVDTLAQEVQSHLGEA